jgi:hypothetical protein
MFASSTVSSIHRSVSTFVSLLGRPTFYLSVPQFATVVALALELGWSIFAASIRVATAVITAVHGVVTPATAFWA